MLTMPSPSPISHVLREYFNYVFLLTTLTFVCSKLFTVFAFLLYSFSSVHINSTLFLRIL